MTINLGVGWETSKSEIQTETGDIYFDQNEKKDTSKSYQDLCLLHRYKTTGVGFSYNASRSLGRLMWTSQLKFRTCHENRRPTPITTRRNAKRRLCWEQKTKHQSGLRQFGVLGKPSETKQLSTFLLPTQCPKFCLPLEWSKAGTSIGSRNSGGLSLQTAASWFHTVPELF